MSEDSNSADEYPEPCYPAGSELREDIGDNLDETNIILIGAPSVGKSWELGQLVAETADAALLSSSYEQEEMRELASTYDIEDRVFTLDECAYASTYDYVILDDFYKLVEESVRRTATNDKDPELALLDLLESDTGLCISTTPYRWNTLNGVSPTDVSDTHWDRLSQLKDRLPILSGESEDRRPDVAQPEANAYTKYVSRLLEGSVKYRYLCYLNDEDASQRLEEADPEDSIKEVSPKAFPTYECPVCQQEGEPFNYETAVPFALFFFSREIAEEFIAEAEETVKVIGHIKGGKKLEHALKPLLKKAPERHPGKGMLDTVSTGMNLAPSVSHHTLMSTFLLGIETTSFTALGVLIHLLFMKLRGGPEELDSVQERFEGLLRLTPPQMELIEQEAGLEPLTLEGYREWTLNPEKRQELDRLVREHEAELKSLRNAVTVPFEDLSVFDDQDVQEIASQVDEGYRSRDVLEVMIETAVQNPDDTLSTYDSVTKYFDRSSGSGAPEWKPADAPDADRIVDTIHMTDDDAPVVLVRGPVGSGKTTAAYQAAIKLRGQGFFVATTDLTELATLKFVFENVSKSTVLFVDDLQDAPIRHVKKTISYLADGVVDTLVVLCRTRPFPSLNAELEDTLSSTGYSEQWGYWKEAKRRSIDVTGLPEEAAVDLLRNNFDGLADDDLKTVLSYSRRDARVNPLFAVVTADAVTTGADLERHENVNNLLWRKVEPFFNQDNWETDADTGRALMLSYTAASRTLSHETLINLVDSIGLLVDPDELVEDIDLYLMKTNSDWTVAPTLLRRLIFMNHCLNRLDTPPDRVLRRFTGRDAVIGLAMNLATLHLREQDQQRCRKYANELLNIIEGDRRYYRCIEELAKGQIPIEPAQLDSDQLVNGIARTTVDDDAPFMIFSSLTAAYQKTDRLDELDALFDTFRAVVDQYQQTYEPQQEATTDQTLEALTILTARVLGQGSEEASP